MDDIVNEAKQLLTGITYCWQCVYLSSNNKEVDVLVCGINSDKKISNISIDGCLGGYSPIKLH